MRQSPRPKEKSWRDFYIAALFESDKAKIARRIAEAQAAIIARRHNLFISGNDFRERQVLDNALFSLEALRTCLAIPLVVGAQKGWQ